LRDIKIPANAKVVILEKSGHRGFIEEPGLSAELISTFARSLDWEPSTYGKRL
jgi:pimeloyl-ACP methyl ester carboxylesterase